MSAPRYRSKAACLNSQRASESALRDERRRSQPRHAIPDATEDPFLTLLLDMFPV
jgi:hypothetical protein